jgi:hypothetical protein
LTAKPTIHEVTAEPPPAHLIARSRDFQGL